MGHSLKIKYEKTLNKHRNAIIKYWNEEVKPVLSECLENRISLNGEKTDLSLFLKNLHEPGRSRKARLPGGQEALLAVETAMNRPALSQVGCLLETSAE